MNTGFDDFEVKAINDVYGVSTINHGKRIKMGLTMNEYVVADFIDYAISKNKPITYEYAHRRIGATKDQFNTTLASLISKGFVITGDKELKLTRKWYDAFMLSEEWFEAFWNVKGKPFWPGSKKEAKEKFIKACKLYTPEYIIQCRDNYIKFLSHPKNQYRQIMGAPVFLNLDKERFKEDWIANLKRITDPGAFTAEQPSPKMSKEEKENMFR